VDPAVASKSVGLADISNYGVIAFPALRVGNIDDFMARSIEHGSDQVVETGIHAGKNGGSGLFYHIDLCQKVSGLTDEKFTGLKSQSEFPAIFLAELVESFGK